jgi:transposase
MIKAEIERCAGIDVGKKFLSVTIMVGPLAGEPRTEKRRFGTIRAELIRLREWLQKESITHAVMESTGSYWKPVFNELEDAVRVYLANPNEVKVRKGHKTDDKDGWWLAHLLRHAMIQPSFIPPRAQRELRDLTRYRKKLLGNGTAEKNRVQKILEDANVKLGDVLGDLFGVGGQLMLDSLLKGEETPQQIAQHAQRRAKNKIPEIIASLEGHQMSDHHRLMIHFHLDHMKVLEEQIAKLDEAIEEQIKKAGMEEQWELLRSVPGVEQTSAATILAEIGPDMKVFPTPGDISSWAGVCPGNNRTAGKNKGSKTTRGNKFVKSALTECAWGAARKNGCFLKEKFWRIKTKSKGKDGPAIVAVGHTLLLLIYHVLTSSEPYQERGVPALDEHQKDRIIRHHIRRLGKLGIAVSSPRAAKGPSGAAQFCRVRSDETKPKGRKTRKATKTSATAEGTPRRKTKSRRQSS